MDTRTTFNKTMAHQSRNDVLTMTAAQMTAAFNQSLQTKTEIYANKFSNFFYRDENTSSMNSDQLQKQGKATIQTFLVRLATTKLKQYSQKEKDTIAMLFSNNVFKTNEEFIDKLIEKFTTKMKESEASEPAYRVSDVEHAAKRFRLEVTAQT